MKKVKLGEIGRIVTGCTPSTKKSEYYERNDYMFVGPSDIKNVMYVVSSEKHISQKAYEDHKTRFINGDSIVVDCIGSDMGNVAIVKEDCLTNQQINAITNIDESNYNIRYVYYVLSTMKNYFHLIGTNGSTMPILNKSMFENIEIEVPDIEIQNKIANILSKLDDKVKLNNEINNNLYELCNNIYESWILKYNVPNKNLKIINNFPENWSIKKIKDLSLDISDGNYSSKYPSKSEFVESGVPFIRGTDFVGTTISRKNLLFISPKKHQELKKGHLKINDILITTRGEIGKIAFVPRWYDDCNINAQLIRINGKEDFPRTFLGCSLLSKNVQSDIQSRVTGTALQQLPVGKFLDVELIIPTDDVIEEFDKLLNPIFNQIEENYNQNEKLEDLRDTLLPKLMNGEINLDNIEI